MEIVLQNPPGNLSQMIKLKSTKKQIEHWNYYYVIYPRYIATDVYRIFNAIAGDNNIICLEIKYKDDYIRL